MNKTRKFISVLMTLSIITVVLAGCGQNESAATKLSDRAVIQDKKFGGVYIDITIDEFNDMGFEFGDGVDITFSNGYELKNIILQWLLYPAGRCTACGLSRLSAHRGRYL